MYKYLKTLQQFAVLLAVTLFIFGTITTLLLSESRSTGYSSIVVAVVILLFSFGGDLYKYAKEFFSGR